MNGTPDILSASAAIGTYMHKGIGMCTRIAMFVDLLMQTLAALSIRVI